VPILSMTVRGSEELKRNLARLAGAERKRAQRQGLEAGARVIESEVKVLLGTPGTGRTYVHGKVTHTASRPGDPPALDTGTLRNSIEVGGVTPNEATVGTNVEYAVHLEFGTAHMGPRPFLRPAIDQHESEIVGAVEDTVAAFVNSVRA